jgi:hypothetical protein
MKPAVNVVVPVYRSEENLEEMCEGGSAENDCSINQAVYPVYAHRRRGPESDDLFDEIRADRCQPGVVAHELAALLGRDLNKPEVHDLGAEAVAALKAESAL